MNLTFIGPIGWDQTRMLKKASHALQLLLTQVDDPEEIEMISSWVEVLERSLLLAQINEGIYHETPNSFKFGRTLVEFMRRQHSQGELGDGPEPRN